MTDSPTSNPSNDLRGYCHCEVVPGVKCAPCRAREEIERLRALIRRWVLDGWSALAPHEKDSIAGIAGSRAAVETPALLPGGYCRRCDAQHRRVYCPDCGLKLIPAEGASMKATGATTCNHPPEARGLTGCGICGATL